MPQPEFDFDDWINYKLSFDEDGTPQLEPRYRLAEAAGCIVNMTYDPTGQCTYLFPPSPKPEPPSTPSE